MPVWTFVLALCVACAGCGSDDFQSPAPPDARITIDLAVSQDHPPADLTCFNSACGGCSAWARFDGTPAAVGDPCLWKGTWQCMGTELTCMGAACPTCPGEMLGSVCGADGHTIIELSHSTATCVAYDFGSSISTCNHQPGDKCVGRCTKNAGGTYSCAAHCLSDDGGGAGCEHQATDTCDTLTSC